MKLLTFLTGLLFVFSTNLLAQNVPVAIDSSVARKLAVAWNHQTKPSTDIACLYGMLEGDSVIVIMDMAVLPGDPKNGCPVDVKYGATLGAVGFIDGNNLPMGVDADAVQNAMCVILKKQTTWHFAGEIWAAIPTVYPGGYWAPAPRIWGCFRLKDESTRQT